MKLHCFLPFSLSDPLWALTKPPLVFRNEKKCGLHELGPRFTLKLRSIQKGTFDSKFGEYEWMHKRHEMDTSRQKFNL
ncbi:RPF1 [Bugula neritina]|uniref:RPF1 n=1 Tax=Bugula neritina TaxID=10212 RepID=A0A7J7JA68_BUGNE|nr:RPF1 [Bugula neritina]